MTDPYENALFFTLETYAHTLGTRKVIEICQQFILDSFPEPRALHFETDSLESESILTEEPPVSNIPVDVPPPTSPSPSPPLVEPPVLQRLKIKRKKVAPPAPEATASPEAKEALAASLSPKKKETVASKRNFKKLVDQNILPIGTIVFPSAPDPLNPATAATIARTPKGQPAIQPSWDKGKFCTGTSQAPMKFLVEARKKFPTLKPYVKENAWDEVLYKHADGSFRVLSDACAQLKS